MRVHHTLLTSIAFLGLGLLPAAAADLVYETPTPAYTPATDSLGDVDWTGGYVGAFGGAATGDFDYEARSGGNTSGIGVSGGGLFGGAQAGYDYQMGSVVVGGVADIAATDIEADVDTRSATGATTASASADSRLKYLGTVRGRVGYAVDRALVYGHGGYAYGKTEAEVSSTVRTGGVSQTATTRTDSDMKHGYVLGAGAEFKATDTISVLTEYGYHDLGQDRIYSGAGQQIDEDVEFHAVKAGVNYRF
ncbi:outer membrane protein [Aurantimonas coralicida]|uniref:Outer membrane protein n=1 Tax=Aurantimonas coralicida TaxID=182270 RepID=A0A0P0YZ64_9HYPH|nr:outer membrane beta-barrel protein [Aurantimonas coralicida]BAT26864.1 outer membrane protein [Aurantimonas coralicida]